MSEAEHESEPELYDPERPDLHCTACGSKAAHHLKAVEETGRCVT